MNAAAPRPNLLPVAAFVSLLVLVLGATGLFSLHYTNLRAEQGRLAYQRTNEVLLTALRTRADFKIQVQEWKNILLRGRDPADFATYRARFEAQSVAVQHGLAHLEESYTALHAGDSAARDITALIEEHSRLEKSYYSALSAFEPADPEAPFRADAAVRGIDRKLGDELDALADAMEKENAGSLIAIAADSAARYEGMRRVTWIVAALATVAALWLVFLANRAARA